ncbi:MAG: hypothetical protein IT160_02945 [Bryobacterales bacterium]|nr:hypothetical protein [Bryobacterales bacterium]
MGTSPELRAGDCVQVPDDRIGRVRGSSDGLYRVRLRRTTSDTHQFVDFKASELVPVECPKGWMSPDGYLRYLRVTLRKMRERQARSRK